MHWFSHAAIGSICVVLAPKGEKMCLKPDYLFWMQLDAGLTLIWIFLYFFLRTNSS